MESEPSARQAHVAIAMGQHMFVLAGDDGPFPNSDIKSSVVERFNLSSISWKLPRQLLDQDRPGTHLPNGYSRMAFASDGENLYLFSGFTKGQRCNTLYEINMTSRVQSSASLTQPSRPYQEYAVNWSI